MLRCRIGDENYLLNELKKLNVDGYQIEISKKVKNGITGTYVDVILEHEHHRHHEHRNLEDINKIKEIALNKGIPLKELYKLDELNINK